jgi:hypothetical protein
MMAGPQTSTYVDNRHDDIVMDASGEPEYAQIKEPVTPDLKVATKAAMPTADASEEPQSPKTPLNVAVGGRLMFGR